MHSHNNTTVHAPGLDLAKTDLDIQGVGPSRAQSTNFNDTASVNVGGDAVELTVSPRRGTAVSFVISPVQPLAPTSSSAVQHHEEQHQPDA
jgi:hypothetical protein